MYAINLPNAEDREDAFINYARLKFFWSCDVEPAIVRWDARGNDFFSKNFYKFSRLWISAFSTLAAFGGFAYILFCLVNGSPPFPLKA